MTKKPLHEKTISELGDHSIATKYELREWAIAIVKEIQKLFIRGGNDMGDWRDADNLKTFLIEKFELKEEDLK